MSINNVSELDALLSGKTQEPAAPAEPPVPEASPPGTEPTNVETQPEKPAASTPEGEDPGNGGDQNLDSTANTEENKADEGAAVEIARQNAAFAKLRAENTRNSKVIAELARALGVDSKDPEVLNSELLRLAQEKLAKEANVPVELYNKLNSTEEKLAAVTLQQNQAKARDTLLNIKATYELSDKEIYEFARTLDNMGIDPIANPDIDLDYHFYRLNGKKLEEKRIKKAVEAALRSSNTADQHSTTPSTTKGKPPGDPETPSKINTVQGLDALLSGK